MSLSLILECLIVYPVNSVNAIVQVSNQSNIPMFCVKKLISLHTGLQIAQFFLCGSLTQYIFRFDKFFAPSTPPTWWYVTKCVKFCHFGESQIKGTPQIGVYPEKFNIGFLAQIFLASFFTCREARKKNWSKKSMLNFSR